MATSKTKQAPAKKPPKRKSQKVKEAKAPAKKKEKAKPIFGSAEFRIHRVLDKVTKRWRASVTSDIGVYTGKAEKLVDSRVHRFGRDVGFIDSDTEHVELDNHLQKVQERLRHLPRCANSEPWRVENQGNFECYVLKAHPQAPYARFLERIQTPKPGQKERLLKPSHVLVGAYIMHMSDEGDTMDLGIDGRKNAFNAVRGRLGAISGTLKDFGLGAYEKNADTAKLMEALKAGNNPKRAKVLNLDEDLPALYLANFSGKVFHSESKRVRTWSRLLVALAVIGRSSDVTEYCPIIEEVEYPTDPQDYFPDGLPRFIVLVWKDWKGRPSWHKTQCPEYRIRLYANPQDLRYCPVHWVFKEWSLRSKDGEPLTGPIIQSVTSTNFMKDLKQLFMAAGLTPCSSHSIRRSAAQWARRCGADLSVIRNIGRWVEYSNLLLYIAEAEKISREKRRNNNGRDPLWDFWMFDTDTQWDTMNKGGS
jgi:hypothetical protein